MKILAASDLHLNTDCRTAILQQAPRADVVIIAGDFAQRRKGLDEFMPPFEAIADKAIFVPGNNETEEELRAATSAKVLHGDTTEWQGLTIAGIGCAIPPLPPLPWGSADMTEDEAETMLGRIAQADILISHSPPYGHCDYHVGLGRHLGSVALETAIRRMNAKLVLCGHVHDSWGARSQIGASTIANVGPVPVFFEV
ncbi:metallophosphoesterase family protein [Yoonia sp. 2307UL14-13]|uniref:metallophosphoesterase family protein n=1 Tax=Yoonia sp. 2307UL14-13 TaxID=3126506 RepID=UPI00309DA3B8